VFFHDTRAIGGNGGNNGQSDAGSAGTAAGAATALVEETGPVAGLAGGGGVPGEINYGDGGVIAGHATQRCGAEEAANNGGICGQGGAVAQGARLETVLVRPVLSRAPPLPLASGLLPVRLALVRPRLRPQSHRAQSHRAQSHRAQSHRAQSHRAQSRAGYR
jgi:hypothetical protein